MKASAITALIISAILIIAGVVMLSIGNSMAKAQNINLFQSPEETDDQGHNIETHELEDETEEVLIAVKTKKETIRNVHETTEKSYVEIINFPKNQFQYSTSNQKLTIEKVGKISDYMTFSSLKDNGLDSWGLRYFFKNNVDKDYPYIINVYFSATTAVKSLSIECGNGEVNLEKISIPTIKYDIKAKNGNVNLHKVSSPLKINVSIDKGNLNLKNNTADDIEANIKKGNLITNTDKQINLVLKCLNGVINTNFKAATVEEHITPESFTEIFPSYEQLGSAETGTIPQLTANIEMGDAAIYYGYETEEEEPAEEEPESDENGETDGENGDADDDAA